MGKVDKRKVAWASLRKQEQSLDKMPHKSTKKAKVKERQQGKKEIAEELWAHREMILLSPKDFKAFEKALRNPPEPNEALKSAIKRYKDNSKK